MIEVTLTIAPPSPGGQQPSREAAAGAHHARQVDVDQRFPVLVLDVREQAEVDLRSAVDQHVDGSEGALRGIEHRLDRLAAADIGPRAILGELKFGSGASRASIFQSG